MMQVTFSTFAIYILLILLLSAVFCAGYFLFCFFGARRARKYRDFVLAHSLAIRELEKINKEFCFLNIPTYHLNHQYDSKVFYDNIAPLDYLTYWLVYKQGEVGTVIRNTGHNKALYTVYRSRVNSCELNRYDAEVLSLKASKLLAMEKKIFCSKLKRPQIEFNIKVDLFLLKINGRFVDVKSATFSLEQIEQVIQRLNQKQGDFYLDRGIWNSICRVERGRVTNKVRFAVYSRDGYRCQKCGRTTNDLEIDHIFPISKGGKSTMDNLQTLCHTCNFNKSNSIEAGPNNHTSPPNGAQYVCPSCAAPLVLRHGQYGDFYGCSNYPKCKFKKRIVSKQ